MPSADPHLALVLESPQRVAEHDREGWLALFTPDGVVLDPVGTTPRCGRAVIGRFWQVFIARNTVRFELHRSFTVPPEVVLDVDLHVDFPSGARIRVPAYLRYVTEGAPDALRLARLEAHWELAAQIRQLLLAGVRGLWASTVSSVLMVRHLGPLALLDYLRVLRGVGRGGHRALGALTEALSRGDADAAIAMFVADGVVELPVGSHALASVVFGAGQRHVLVVERPISAGRTTVFRYVHEHGDATTRGVAFAHFAPSELRLTRLRFFPE